MEESKIFQKIWQFNAIAIAVATILVVVISLFAAYFIYKDNTRDRHRNEIVNLNPETEIKENLRIGRLRHVKGSESIILPLYSDQNFGVKFSRSKSTSSTRNLLFSNIRDETNKWLLPNNDFLISSYRLIDGTNSYDSDKDIVAVIYNIVKADTNNDTRLTENDDITVEFSTPSGGLYTEVLQRVGSVLGYDIINEHAIAIIFNRSGQVYTAYINLSNFKVTKEIELPIIR